VWEVEIQEEEDIESMKFPERKSVSMSVVSFFPSETGNTWRGVESTALSTSLTLGKRMECSL
jgi:hypothetical protein